MPTLSPLICAFGHHSLVTVLTRCGLPLPTYILADEKHSRCLTERVYLPTIVRGCVLWHLGYSASQSTAAFTESYGAFQRAALEHEPSYQVRDAFTDGFDSTVNSMGTLLVFYKLREIEPSTLHEICNSIGSGHPGGCDISCTCHWSRMGRWTWYPTPYTL